MIASLVPRPDRNIWEKAVELLADAHAVTAAPVEGEARMVKSRSNPARPHLVRVLNRANVVCDENCQLWASMKICSHCVAVATSLGCISGFVKWFVANVKKPNITKLTMSNVPLSAYTTERPSRVTTRLRLV